MSYALRIRLPGDPVFGPLASRAIRELKTFPNGPGEEITRLLPSLESLLTAILQALKGEAKERTLLLQLEADEIHLQIGLQVDPVSGKKTSTPLLSDPGVVKRLERVFDDVEMIGDSGSHGGLQLSLVRYIPC